MRHHAFVIEGEAGEGIETALAWVERELEMKRENNPDIVVLNYGLLSVEDARAIVESAIQAPFRGEHKALIIAANRVYHEAQNALLKLFEEPPRGTYLFLIVPALGGLLPTLRSRVQPISLSSSGRPKIGTSEIAEAFLRASREKRSTIIKRLTSGRDEEERRELRDEAIALVNGIEAAAYQHVGLRKSHAGKNKALIGLLSDIAVLRGYLHDRSVPVKMILEHLSLVTPKSFGILQ